MAAYDNVQLPAGPTPASYAPKLIDFSALANIGQQFQEGQQYGVKRGLQTMFPDGNYPTDPASGGPDIGAIAKKAMAIGGPEAAQPYLNMLFDQQNSKDFAKIGQPGQPQQQPQAPQPGQPPQTFTPMASNAATGPGGIDPSKQPRSGQPGSILRDGEQIMGDGAAPQEGAGRGGLPAPFAGTRDQQTAQAGPASGARTVTEDGTTGQPIAPTSAREASHNGPSAVDADPRWSEVNRLKQIATQYNAVAARMTARPQLAAQAKDAADRAGKEAQTRAEAIYKDYELTTAAKDAVNPSVAVAAGAVESAKAGAAADTKYYDAVYRGLTGSATIAAQQKQNVGLLRQIAESQNFIPGAGSELALGYQRLMAQFGINPTGAAPREVFNQLAARVLADQFSGMKSMASETGEQGARIFKPMLDIEEKANITPTDSLEGVKAKLNLLDKSGDLMMHYGDMADDYKSAHGKLDPAFNKSIRAEIAGSRMNSVMPAASGAVPIAPQSIKTNQDADAWVKSQGLKPGDQFRAPDGKIRHVPGEPAAKPAQRPAMQS